ncbi:MAG: 4'-phosphopantetheinyl transferase superfamily protein [Bacteroidota bacterium]
MIGNDLIAFNACRHYSFRRWQAYWGKVLNDTEWEHFHFAPNEQTAWLYWAAKEAAWKVWNRRSAQRLLNPKAFRVKNIIWQGNKALFEVSGPDECLKGSAIINEKYLHAMVKSEAVNKTVCRICQRDLLLDTLNQEEPLRQYSLLSKDLSPQSKPQISLSRNILGIPSLEIDGNVLDLPISLSHHGPWAAYAYVYPHRTQP